MSSELLKKIEELELKLLDVNEKNKNLKIEKEKLENRFGLVWKNIPEKFIKYLSDKEVVYGRSKYTYIADIKSGSGKKLKLELEGEDKDIIRQSDSYLFKDCDGVPYLSYSGKVYVFEENTNELFVPILEKKGVNYNFGDSDKNILIEGDNYFALQMLQYTHQKKIDVIYIDPPYNTGNGDFKYNDVFIKDEDGNKHSSWLSFMEKRLILAKTLLSEDGVIFVSIDDNEGFLLKILMDKIFGEDNFINAIAVSMSNMSGVKMAHAADGGKYPKQKEMLFIYSKNKNKKIIKPLKYPKEEWNYKYNKIFTNISDKEVEKINNFLNGDISLLEEINNLLLNVNYKSVTKEIKENDSNFLRNNAKKIFRQCSSNSVKKYVKEQYPEKIGEDGFVALLSPTNKPYIATTRFGATAKSPDVQLELASRNLDTYYSDIWSDINTNKLGAEMPSGMPCFNNGQKPFVLLNRIINSFYKKDILILDFFAGSGSTGHAVWDLNKKDGGKRKFILVTNNENNICEEITFERLKKSNEQYKYNESLEYLKIRHIEDREINKEDFQNDFNTLKEIINLRFDSFSIVEETEDWYVTEKLAVLKKSIKKDDFFKKFKNHKNYALIAQQERKFKNFLETAKYHTNIENVYHMSKDYLNDIKKQLRKDEK